MKPYLCAGFGQPISGTDLTLIASLGFGGIRQDVLSVDAVDTLVKQFANFPLYPWFVVGGGQQGGPQQQPDAVIQVAKAVATAMKAYSVAGSIEIGNELDISPIYKDDPDKAGRLWQDAALNVRVVSMSPIVFTGGITNTSDVALEWLDHALGAAPALPGAVRIAFHSYRSNPDAASHGFQSRADEMRELRTIVGSRTIACTEVGYQTASKRKCLGIKTAGLSDQQVFEYAKAEDAFFNAIVCEYAWYQLNDGPSDTPLDRYGIRRFDGTLKPVSQTWK